MTTISATTLRNNLFASLEQVEKSKDYMVITTRGKIHSALVNIDLFEDLLAMTNKKYLASIKRARADAKAGKLFTHDEVFGDLK